MPKYDDSVKHELRLSPTSSASLHVDATINGFIVTVGDNRGFTVLPTRLVASGIEELTQILYDVQVQQRRAIIKHFTEEVK